MWVRGRLARRPVAVALVGTVGAACVAPAPLEPPPAPSWVAEAGEELFAYHAGDPPVFFAESPPVLFHGYPTNGLEGVPRGRLEPPVERPCPLPPTAERWRVDGDALQPAPLAQATVPGWFEGPEVPSTPVAIMTPCGPGGISLTATRRGCAIEFRTTDPLAPRGRLGVARGPDGAWVLDAFEATTLGAECVSDPSSVRVGALGSLRCIEASKEVCPIDVYDEPPEVPATRVEPGAIDPTFTPPENPLQPPFARRWSGLALTARHVWIARETQSADYTPDCREAATLVGLPRVPGAQRLERAAPADTPCITELFARPGVPGFFALARSATAARELCPIPSREPWRPRPWVLVHLDDDGRPTGHRTIGGACGPRLALSEPEAEGAMGLAASETFGDGPRRSWAWTITPERLEVSSPLVLERDPAAPGDSGVELASLTREAGALVLGLDLQRKRFVELELASGLGGRPATIQNPRRLPSLGRESAELPAWHRRTPDGRLVGFTAGDRTSGGVLWTARRVDSPSSEFTFVSSVAATGDVLAAEPWPRASWLGTPRARLAIIRTDHRTRESELRWYEVDENEPRLYERPERVRLGAEPPFPRLAVDEDDGLWILMAWSGAVFRVSPP